MADAVVLVAGGLIAAGLVGEATAGVVAERGGETIGIDDRQGSTIGVIAGDLGDVAQGVGDRREVAAFAQVGIIRGVVAVGGDIINVGDGRECVHGRAARGRSEVRVRNGHFAGGSGSVGKVW